MLSTIQFSCLYSASLKTDSFFLLGTVLNKHDVYCISSRLGFKFAFLKEGDIGGFWTPQYRKKFRQIPQYRKKNRQIPQHLNTESKLDVTLK